MFEDSSEIRIMLAPLSEGTMILPWPAELDPQQRHYVLEELVTQLQSYAIRIQPDDVSDPRWCHLRADAETWQYQGAMIASVLRNVVHQAIGDRSVEVGFANAG